MKKIIPILFLAIASMGCRNKAQEEANIQAAKQAAIDSIAQVEGMRQRIVDSMNEVAEQQHAEAAAQQRVAVSSTRSYEGYRSSAPASAPAAVAKTTTPAKQKKGWTGATKGAIIGAGVGAVTGAMVDKRKGEGAIVGGLLGAGAGAGTGALIDKSKKNKEKKQQEQQTEE